MPTGSRRRSRLSVLLATVLMLTGVVAISPSSPAAAVTTPASTVFINELHYDNDGADVGEFFEIAGPAGTDLSGWSVLLYNGSNGAPDGTVISLSGTIPDQDDGFGTLSFLEAGIQNGSPDGLALIDDTGTVIEFLSYEGTFIGAAGPAGGLMSTNIGVFEPPSTPVGQSLSRTGTGTTAGDFTFQSPAAESPGSVNIGQDFGAASITDPVINELGISDASTDNEFVEIFGDPSTDYSTYTVLQLESDPGTSAGFIEDVVTVGTTDADGLWFTDVSADSFENGDSSFLLVENFTGAENDDLDTNDDGTLDTTPWDRIVDSVSINEDGGVFYGTPIIDETFDDARLNSSFAPGGISRIPDGADTDTTADWYRNDFDWDGTTNNGLEEGEALNTPGAPNQIFVPVPPVLINEVDADQTSTDVGEFIELTDRGVGNTALDGLVLVLFNGSTDESYASFDLDGQSTGADGYFVLCGDAAEVADCDLDVSPDSNLIQNGADAVALYTGDATSFPDGTAVTTIDLMDAVVYDTDDPDDAALLVLLNDGGQIDENANGNGTTESMSRCPDSSGTGRDTTVFDTVTPTPGAINSCTIVPPTVTVISAIQGTGSSVAITTPVTVQAVVTSLFENNDELDGFFIQEEDTDADADPSTSEGIFVFCRGACPANLAVGDLVTISGTPTDFQGMSQIASVSSISIDSSNNPLPTATPVDLPASGSTSTEATFESIEGMLVAFPDKLVISEYFELARFGQIVLTADERPQQFTDENLPSVAGYAAFLADLERRRIVLDDNNSNQNDAIFGPESDEPYPWPQPGFSTTNVFRGGESITGLTGVMHWSWAGSPGTDAWRIRPIDGIDYTFTADENPRDLTPADVGGTLEIASFNVLNYFATLDESGNTCGPNALGCRGADSEAERIRQLDKIVAALAAMNSDVVGLIEIENDSDDAAVNQIVDALNVALGAGAYDSIDTGFIGGDAIKVAFIFKPSTVTPVGDFAILDSSVDPTFIDDKNRPALIQTFEENATGERVTVTVNHLKSKGSPCDDVGDPDRLDGQARCPGTRADAATALATYLATDPTGSGSENVLIMGDLNAYAMEDAIMNLENAGYTDLIEQFLGTTAYGYVFDGQTGYLDHALANPAVLPLVTGVDTWHINADEVNVLDYDDGIQDATEQSFNRKSNGLDIYDPDQFRSSDHDPVIVGLDLAGGGADTLVLVTGQAANPGPGDRAAVQIAEDLGFDVVLIDDDEADVRAAVLAESPDVVLLSSTVVLSKVEDALANLGVGLVTWEAYLHDDNLLATRSAETAPDNRLIITEPTHPVAAGLSGTVFVTAPAAPQSFLIPAGESTNVAASRAIPARSVVAAWDTGDLLADGNPSAARTVAFFTNFASPGFLTTDGQAMFEAAITWAAGGTTTPVNESPTVDAGADQSIRLPVDTVSIDATSDDDGLLAALTFSWTQIAGPQTATIATPNAEDTDITFPVAGTYEFQLEVDDGELAATDTVVVTVLPDGAQVLFVAGSSSPPLGDRTIVERLEAAGATVTILNDDDVAGGVDLAGIDAVFVSTSVVISKVGDAFKSATIPVVIWEGFLLDDMGIGRSGETGTTFATVDIADPADPLAAGLTGSPTIYTQANKLTFAVVGAEADVAATQPGRANRAVVGSYDAGDVLVDGTTAAGDRYFFFADYFGAQRLNANGIAIVDAVITAALS